MSNDYAEQQVDRRNFMKAAVATAVAAAATGAGAAMLCSRPDAVTVVPPPALPAAQAIVAGHDQAADALAQLAAAQAENVRLRANLAAAQRRLDAQILGTDTAVQTLTVELDEAHKQLGLMAGLVALYEQLDDVDAMAWLEEGVTAVTDAITDLTDDLPSLSEGVALGRQALDDLDEHIPLLEDGRTWLDRQTDKLQEHFEAIETLLATAVDRAGPVLQMFNEWAQTVLKWLPFNLGQRAAAIMEGLTSLLAETPAAISGLRVNVAAPLAALLDDGDSRVSLRQNLIRPLRERVLTDADRVINKSDLVQKTYQNEFVLPMETAVINHRQALDRIIAYRQQHQLG